MLSCSLHDACLTPAPSRQARALSPSAPTRGPRAAQSRNNTMDRWTPAMLPTVPEALWRKSPQWVALNRKHALLAASDTVVNAVIRDHCSIGYDDLLGRCARPLLVRASARLCLLTAAPLAGLLRPSGVCSSHA